MELLGNILWLLLIGPCTAVSWAIAGVLWCLTIIWIPLGIQCFKMAYLTLWPFGKEVIYSDNIGFGFINVAWILLSGIEIAFVYLILGIACCLTIIGIPFGIQLFKMMKLCFAPFGTEVK